MKNIIRFGMPLSFAIFVVCFALLPIADRITHRWFAGDVHARARLIFSSIEEQVRDGVELKSPDRVESLFLRVAQDERVIGLAYCDGNVLPSVKSNFFPVTYRCGSFAGAKDDNKALIVMPKQKTIYTSFSLSTPQMPHLGYLVIAHDLGYIERREHSARKYIFTLLLIVAAVVSIVTAGVARLILSEWVRGVRDFVRHGKLPRGAGRETLPLIKEIRAELRKLEKEYQYQRHNESLWTEQKLQHFIEQNFGAAQVLIASFREPVSHFVDENGAVTIKRNVNGLVTAMEPVVRACHGTWIAIGVGHPADGSLDRVGIEEFGKKYTLLRIRPDDSDYKNFYHGICSGGLYPLCCSMGYIKPVFSADDWDAYVRINQQYADAIISESRGSAPIILVQDYQLALVPGMIKKKLPDAIIVLYWHIPWPNSEIFSILPWGDLFLDGILASDIVGFQTPYMRNNFFDAVRANLEARIDMEQNSVERFGHNCLVRSWPVSIEWPLESLAGVESVDECRENIRGALGIPIDNKVFIGVERMDYVKGIPERMRAFQSYLRECPEMHGKVNFIQIAALSPRKDMGVYTQTAALVQQICIEINEEFGFPGWTPVYLRLENHSKQDVYRFYRASDVCVVSSLHDGMNLVAKEFIACRNDNRGVVIVSRFAGAARELAHSLVVNPHDHREFVRVLARAATMPEDLQDCQMQDMRQHIQKNNIYGWAGRMLADAAILYRRQKVNIAIGAIDIERSFYVTNRSGNDTVTPGEAA